LGRSAGSATAGLDPPEISTISRRAIAIARGLRRSGRVGDLRAAFSGDGDDDVERWLTIPACGGRFYFLRIDGGELRKGEDFISSDELSGGFTAAMARVASLHEGVDPTKS
jgi:hypothetical protein